HAALESARRGDGGLVEVVGPTGIGKSRLVERFIETAAPPRLLRAETDPYGTVKPYGGVRRHVRAWRGAAGAGGGRAHARPARRGTPLTLEPLDREDCSTVVVDAADVLDDATVARVVAASGGNPLFAISLARDRGTGDDLPSAVAGVVTARLDGLAHRDRAF